MYLVINWNFGTPHLAQIHNTPEDAERYAINATRDDLGARYYIINVNANAHPDTPFEWSMVRNEGANTMVYSWEDRS